MHSDLQDLRSPSARAPGLIVPIGGQDTPLSLRLRQGTRQAHRNIERMALVRGMLRGVLRQATYRRMLIDLYPVYSALEWGLSHNAHHPAVASIFEPRLWRGTAIAADLTFLDLRMGCDRGWQHTPPSAAAQRYAAHLTHLALTQPALLLGHGDGLFLARKDGHGKAAILVQRVALAQLEPAHRQVAQHRLHKGAPRGRNRVDTAQRVGQLAKQQDVATCHGPTSISVPTKYRFLKYIILFC